MGKGSAESAPLRVLLIDDDEDDWILTRDMLREVHGSGSSIDWVRTYDAGRNALGGGDYAVCLLDYQLGGRTGLDLLHEAVASKWPTPIILLTGQGDLDLDIAAMEAGAADYLVKGEISPRSLERAIRYAQQRRRTEEILALRERAEALAEADRRKNQFLAMLAHELRNPLAGVRNALYVLAASGAPEAARQRALRAANRQVDHQVRLVDDLLDVSRITSGKIELHRELTDLRRILQETVQDLALTGEHARVFFTLELPPEPLWVLADPVRVAQVIGNLLGNAVKFSAPPPHRDAPGHVTVRARSTPGGMEVSLRDNGRGMGPDLLPYVFDPFVQGRQGLARHHGGLGLGLALVRGLVELHGGTIRAHSEGEGHGSEFTFTLPAAEAPTGLPRATPPPVSQGGRRVLLVEDNQDAMETLRDLLELHGHEVAVAADGSEGVSQARSYLPDVVLCDLGLPELDGFAVARALRSDPATQGMRLIALTGYGREEDARRCRESGFDKHLTKPVYLPDLLRTLDECPTRAPAGG